MSEEVVVQTPEQIAIEKEARLLGWVEKEKYRDGDHWVDAESFVKRGKEINPILRKNNEILLKKLDQANAEISEVKKVTEEFKKFTKEVADRKVAELQKELVELKEQKKAAVSQGDGEAVVVIDDAIDAIKEEQRIAKEPPKEPTPTKQVSQAIDPIITEWMGENEWFGTDSKYTRVADAVGTEINQRFPDLRGKDFFNKLDEELAEVLPEKYLKKGRTSPVEGASQGTSRPTGSKKQSYQHLPADAKAACDKYVKSGLMTQEEYVNEYDWS